MILYKESQMNPLKCYLSMFIKVAEHKINIQKTIVFPCTSNEKSKNEIRKKLYL